MDNQVIDILKTVIKQYGFSILTDAKRCRALLTDHCCGAYVREVKLLLFALEEGVATDLQNTTTDLPASLLHSRLVDRMVTERYLDRTVADWVVRTWGDALGVLFPTVASAPEKVATQSPMQNNIANTSVNTLNSRQIQLGIELIHIPAGDFLYGDKKERKNLPDFEIMKTPVTVAQYRHFCHATKRKMPSSPEWGWQDKHPMVNVSWHDATTFAEWAGLALPTEMEWEKAACGTDGRLYPWGNNWDTTKCCNNAGKSAGKTSPVGSFLAGNSPYGVQDMSGNVWEWCDSGYSENSTRVLRGGSWRGSHPDYFRAACRVNYSPTYRHFNLGFRCVLRSP